MAEYDNNNSGVLFTNRDKEIDNPEHLKWADYKGSAEVDGVEYWVSAWARTAKRGESIGKRFYSLSFTKKQPLDKPEKIHDPYIEKELKETVPEDIPEGPVDMSDIPF